MNWTLFIALVLLTSALTALMARVGRRYLLDLPNQRSSHTIPTPRGGGIAMLVAASVGILILREPVLRMAFVPVFLIAIISFIDDLQSLSSRARLLAHCAIAVFAVVLIGRFASITIPGIVRVTASGVLLMLTILWLVGLTNAYNFMDGIDGIAAVQGIVAGAAWWWLGTHFGLPTIGTLGALVAAVCLGFIPFNWPRAKIFMGDVGSASLGLMVALLPILALSQDRLATWAPAAGVLVVWPFLFDTLFTLARRARRREPLLEAHRSHIYQRLVIAGWSHGRTTVLYGMIAAVNAVAAVSLANGVVIWSWVVALGSATLLLLLLARVEHRAVP